MKLCHDCHLYIYHHTNICYICIYQHISACLHPNILLSVCLPILKYMLSVCQPTLKCMLNVIAGSYNVRIAAQHNPMIMPHGLKIATISKCTQYVHCVPVIYIVSGGEKTGMYSRNIMFFLANAHQEYHVLHMYARNIVFLHVYSGNIIFVHVYIL